MRDVLHARRIRRAAAAAEGVAAAAGGAAAVAAAATAPAAAPDGAAAAPGGDAGGVRVVLPIGRSLFRTVATRARAQKRKRVLRAGFSQKRLLAEKTAAARVGSLLSRKEQKLERVRSAHVARQRAVAQVWAAGVATTYDDVLNPNLTMGITKHDQSVPNALRKGSWRTSVTPAAALRIAFQETNEEGALSQTTFFGRGSSCYKVEILMITASAVLQEQRAAIDVRVKAGGKWIRVTWEMDSTPQQVQLHEPEAVALVSHTGVREDACDQAGTREVLVQRAEMQTDTMPGAEEVIVDPTVVGDTTSGTMLDALLIAMDRAGLNLEVLNANFGLVVLYPGIDGVASAVLSIDYLRLALRPLEHVVVVSSPDATCFMHLLNRCTADHVSQKHVDLSGSFRTDLSLDGPMCS